MRNFNMGFDYFAKRFVGFDSIKYFFCCNFSLSDKKYNSDNTLHLYLRVSSEVQVEGGVGIDLQKNVGIKRSKELGMNWCIHNEGGKSSYSDDLNNRPIMRNLLDGMDKNIVKHLYFFVIS